MRLSQSRRTPDTPADVAQKKAIEARAQQAAAGDLDAMSDLIEAFHDATYRYVFAQVRNQHIAEDVNAKAWLKVVRNMGGYTTEGAGFPAWLYTIVKRTIVDEYRTAHRGREIPTADMLAIGATMRAVSSEATPEESALDSERVGDLREQVAAALAALPPNQRRALIHRFYEGLDVPATASVMQMTASNVRNLQSRGIRRLRTLLPDREVLSVALNAAQEKVIANAPHATHAPH
jgi:RNA polymerase sigma-70 factor (ECF subfamily)